MHSIINPADEIRDVSTGKPIHGLNEFLRRRREEGRRLAKIGKLREAKTVFAEIGDYLDMSVVLAMERRYPEALEAADAALLMNPVGAHAQIECIYAALGDIESMEQHVTAGLLLEPDNPRLRVARAVIRLGRGQYDAATWADFKFRTWYRPGADKAPFPEWDGSDLCGKNLILLQEQGLGDQIMWARCLNDLARFNPGTIIIHPNEALERLFRASFPNCTVVLADTPHKPRVDAWASFGTLPIAGASIAWPGPYLAPLAGSVEEFSRHVPITGRLRVGLCWAGGPEFKNDADRSMPFSSLAPILDVDGVDFYAVQFGHPAAENDRIPDLSLVCRDFADTAAILHNLDLLITVDTSIANFGGALGTPTWVMLRNPLDYRWGFPEERNDWYGPNMRQFRNVIPQVVADALREKVTDAMRATPKPAPINVDRISCVHTRYGKMRVFTNDIWCSRSLQLYGEWSEGEMDVMRAMLPADGSGIAIEAGGNVGAHTLGLARCCSALYTFEPQSQAFELLSENVSLNCPWVHIYSQGLGAEDTTAKMFPADMNKRGNPGGCELHTADEDGGEEVHVVTIDERLVLPRLDLIKLDVEGCELLALRGAEKSIMKYRPALYVEDDRPDQQDMMYAWLVRHGYKIFQHRIPMWNAKNWRGMEVNAFGAHVSIMLLAVPEERVDLLASRYCGGTK